MLFVALVALPLFASGLLMAAARVAGRADSALARMSFPAQAALTLPPGEPVLLHAPRA